MLGSGAIAATLAALVLLAGPVSQAAQDPPPAQAQNPPPAQTQTPPPAPGQAPAFRTGVELVSLNVTATDTAGRYVTDLQQGDFSVFEDGVKQDVTFFTRSNLPVALS